MVFAVVAVTLGSQEQAVSQEKQEEVGESKVDLQTAQGTYGYYGGHHSPYHGHGYYAPAHYGYGNSNPFVFQKQAFNLTMQPIRPNVRTNLALLPFLSNAIPYSPTVLTLRFLAWTSIIEPGHHGHGAYNQGHNVGHYGGHHAGNLIFGGVERGYITTEIHLSGYGSQYGQSGYTSINKVVSHHSSGHVGSHGHAGAHGYSNRHNHGGKPIGFTLKIHCSIKSFLPRLRSRRVRTRPRTWALWTWSLLNLEKIMQDSKMQLVTIADLDVSIIVGLINIRLKYP